MSADLLNRLAEAGTPMDLIMEVAETLAEARAAERLLERRRSKDRERKRSRSVDSAETVEIAESAETPSPCSPLNGFPTPLPNNPPLSPIPEPPVAKATAPIPDATPGLKPEQVLEAWNVMADEAGLPKAKLTPERRKKLRTFVRRHSVDDITEAIWAIPRSPFLRGENDRGWRANFDFLLQPSSFAKITEGTYDR